MCVLGGEGGHITSHNMLNFVQHLFCCILTICHNPCHPSCITPFSFTPTYIPCLVGLLGDGWMFFSSMKSAFQCCAELFRAVYCFSSDLTSVQWRSVVCTMLLIKCSGLDFMWADNEMQWSAMLFSEDQSLEWSGFSCYLAAVQWVIMLAVLCLSVLSSAVQCTALQCTAVCRERVWETRKWE